jgi:hypothetical protein
MNRQRLDALARLLVTLAGLSDMGYLIVYGVIHWRVPTLLLTLAWIMIVLHFWPEPWRK